MKITWIADYDTLDHKGGAQQTNKILIEHGKNIGFKIQEITLKNYEKETPTGLVILNNIAKLYLKDPEYIKHIIGAYPYIRYEHDYLWMGDVPMPFVHTIFANSKLNVFVSPMHREAHRVQGIQIKRDRIRPSPIEMERFEGIVKNPRKNTVIYMGGIAKHKGIDNIFNHARNHRKYHYDLYGWVEHGELLENKPSNCSILSPVPYDEVPKILSEHEMAIHLPNWKEPFGRFVAETFVAGCKLITNDNIGFMSYPWFDWDRERVVDKLKDAGAHFWQMVYESNGNY